MYNRGKIHQGTRMTVLIKDTELFSLLCSLDTTKICLNLLKFHIPVSYTGRTIIHFHSSSGLYTGGNCSSSES